MKKIFLLSIIACSLFITGCGCSKKEETKTVVCNRSNETDYYNYLGKVEIQYKTDIVSLITENDNYVFKNENYENILNEYSESYNWQYSELIDLKYFDIEQEKNVNSLNVKILVNYDKIDKTKLKELGTIYGEDIEDNKLSLDDAINVYRRLEYKCEY